MEKNPLKSTASFLGIYCGIYWICSGFDMSPLEILDPMRISTHGAGLVRNIYRIYRKPWFKMKEIKLNTPGKRLHNYDNYGKPSIFSLVKL